MVRGKAEHFWQPHEISWLKENAYGLSNADITRKFNDYFGLSLSVECVKRCKNRNHISSGLTGHFPKGNVPFNKGKKGYIGANATSFKPGQKPRNTDPIGTEKMLADGYVWIKIDDKPKVPKTVNWKQKHRIVWEHEFGPIPEGHMIIFLDGDHENFDIDNLAMITKAENLIMNRKGLFKPDKDITKTGVQLAKLIDVTNKKVKKC